MSYSSTDFLTEWLTYSLNLKFEDETVFTNFAVSILQNINHFARPNRTDLCNYFYQFESINSNKYKINSRIRSFLATELLSHYDLDESHSLKEKKIENNIINDIYDLIQLSTASENAFRNTDISGIFNIINPDVNKKINNIQELYDNLNKIINQKHQVVLKQLKSSKDLISSQSKTISSLIEQNTSLKNELNKVNTALEAIQNKLPVNNQPFPQVFNRTLYSTATATNVASPTVNLHNTPQNPRKRSNENTSAPSNNNKNKNIRDSTRPNKKSLHSFNSFDPTQKSIPIDSDAPSDDFIVAGKKKLEKRQRSIQNKEYSKNVGRSVDSGLLTRQRKFFVYFGNININATTEEVKKELQRILNGITYDDFAEINENDPNRKFKSFKFSIGYLDKSIIDNKEIWPRYSIVNKFKLSLAEWQKISSTFKKKTDSMLTVAASKQTALSTLSTIESTSNSNKTNNTIADE